MANTKTIEDKVERKKAKRVARAKAAPLGERDYPRGSKKQKVKKAGKALGKR